MEPRAEAIDVQGMLERAEELRQARQLTEARDLLIDALQHNQQVPQVYYRLGNIYHDLKDWDKAEYAYRRALDHDPKLVNAHHNLSVVYRRQGRVHESVRQRRKASRIARQNPGQVNFNEEQSAALRRFAKQVLLVGLGIIVVIVIGLVLLAQFAG
jgi:tetratricopeptide (TPR) repeat protein